MSGSEKPPFTVAESVRLLAGYYADADIGRALRGLAAYADVARENAELRDELRAARKTIETQDAQYSVLDRLARGNEESLADLNATMREIRRVCIASVRGEEHAATLTDAEVDAHLMSTPVDVGNLAARVRATEIERDAAFNRGVETMREAAANVAAECASERGHAQATMFAANRPDDAFVVGIKGGEASRIEALIRALKVAQ